MAFQLANRCARSSSQRHTTLTVHQMRANTRIRFLCAVTALARPIASFVVAPPHLSVGDPRVAASKRSDKRTSKFMTTTDDDDPLKWERMYQQKSSSATLFKDSVDESPPVRSQIRVVTFDLDDTLWKTGATISAANDILSEHLSSLGIQQPKRTESIMGELFQADKPRYAPVQGENATAPVRLTQLRKDAIVFIATKYNNYTAADAAGVAESAFEVWKRGRHDAINSHMAESVVTCLEQLSRLRTADGHKILIGAITDGNSEPALVADIGQYFDFCVNAEQVGVGKPDRQVYVRAIKQVQSRWRGSAVSGTEALIDPDTSMAGPWWVHVGDDFLKDIVAVKDFGMRSIWSRELVKERSTKEAEKKDTTAKSTKSLSDFNAEISSKRIIRMPIGAEDYLANSLEKEFADGVVDRFVDILDLLLEWHKEGLAHGGLTNDVLTDSDKILADVLTDSDKIFADDALEALPAPSMIDRRSDQASAATEDSLATTTKFCLFCGDQLPVSAIFCSSCGKKQA